MKAAEIRRSFVDFFVAKGHRHVPGVSLVPDAMATTLFTIAGMEPFVRSFLGVVPPPAPRVVSVQRCMRVAGTKNDLENVGRTGRHATFLEMLGNFSFGDYYKREAILWAWEYLTATLRLSPERLSATVYMDDDEAAQIWEQDVRLPQARIARFREDNFWDMGPTGPCGPSSEIFFDLGESCGCARPDCGVGCAHCDRFVEIWNLVFQQYDRDSGGTLHPLPKRCIDTGMGFERLCMVLGGKTSIFETELYQDIIAALPPVGAAEVAEETAAVARRIIADHARAATFLIADGVMPGNSDRGYVLRFLIRRAIRSGKALGYGGDYFAALVPSVIATLRDGYPTLPEAQGRIVSVLQSEAHQFGQTLARGEARLDALIAQLRAAGRDTLDGRAVFELHDTYGFPPELTAEIAAEKRLAVDLSGYREAMEQQRERARIDSRTKRAQLRVENLAAQTTEPTEFVGYAQLAATARVVALMDQSGTPAQLLEKGQSGAVALDRTPFYAERGGQMGDRGVIAYGSTVFDVDTTQYEDKSQRRIFHAGRVSEGTLRVGETVDALVDPAWRREIRRHHTVTHLLQRALKDVVGEAVVQRGSAVFPDRTRFDFDSPVGALSRDRRDEVTARVNELIRADYHERVETMPLAQAVARGAIYMQGEHYGDIVRVVTFGPSVELCAGTHCDSTGEIGHFVLLSETAIAAGIRRAEGLVSQAADAYVGSLRHAVESASTALSAGADNLPESAARLVRERRELEKKIAALSLRLAQSRVEEYAARAQDVGGVSYLALEVAADGLGLRELAASLRERMTSGILALASKSGSDVSLIVTVSADLLSRGLAAKEILAAMIPHVAGKGGGTPAQAQGAGKNVGGVDAALQAVPEAIRAALHG
ncbi:MAG: alanine--tRNA ligase [Candidatus Eremiobacteraeota bacterium]|nr:alanine--tRNA ligase [Candidatus Eremiobacteraeota bacterium]